MSQKQCVPGLLLRSRLRVCGERFELDGVVTAEEAHAIAAIER